MPLFSTGWETRLGYSVNGEDLPAKKTAAGANPAMVDAVKAAVRVMNEAKTTTSIMGIAVDLPDDVKKDIDETDRLLCTAARSAVAHQQAIGSARLVRLGLLVSDWQRLRAQIPAAVMARDLVIQETASFRERARAMAEEVLAASRSESAIAHAKPIPWKIITIAAGSLFVIILGRGMYRAWQDEKNYEYDKD